MLRTLTLRCCVERISKTGKGVLLYGELVVCLCEKSFGQVCMGLGRDFSLLFHSATCLCFCYSTQSLLLD